MKTRIVLFCQTAFLMLLFSKLKAQEIGIDSKGKSVFSFYGRSTSRVDIDVSKVSFSTSFRNIDKKIIRTSKNSVSTSVDKFKGWFTQISMLNADEYFLLSKLNKLRPGIGIKLGFQEGIDTFVNIDRIPNPWKGTYTFAANLIFNIDNIKIYNTDKNIEEKKYPVTVGGELNFSYFFKNSRFLEVRNNKTHLRNAVSANLTLSRTSNKDDLLQYQNESNIVTNGTVVAMEDFEGKYGVLKEDVFKLRFAASAPMYYWYFNPIPYFVFTIASAQKPTYHFGLFNNILSTKLPLKKFTIPSSVGLGIDWVKNSSSFSKPNIFFKGSISF